MTATYADAAKLSTRHPLSRTLLVLTVVSGLIDAVSYLGLGHVFTANMTGNVVIAGFALAGAPGFESRRPEVSSPVTAGSGRAVSPKRLPVKGRCVWAMSFVPGQC